MFGTSILILALIQIFPSSSLLWPKLSSLRSCTRWPLRVSGALQRPCHRLWLGQQCACACCHQRTTPAWAGACLGGESPVTHLPAACTLLCLQRVASHRAADWRDFGKSDTLVSKPKPTDVAVRVAASVSLTRLLLLGSDSNCSDQTWSKKWRQL